MSAEDRTRKPRVEILGPETAPTPQPEQAPTTAGGRLPPLELPPAGFIKTALMNAFYHRSTERAIDAYRKAVAADAAARRALAERDIARLEHKRARSVLEDADRILKEDADERREKSIKAEQKANRAEVDAEIEDMENEQRLIQARRAHQKFQKKQVEGDREVLDLDDLSQDEKEFVKDLKASTKAARYRKIAEAIIEDFKREQRELGESLTPEGEVHIKALRAKAEELIRESTDL